jgi:hypothetical protein
MAADGWNMAAIGGLAPISGRAQVWSEWREGQDDGGCTATWACVGSRWSNAEPTVIMNKIPVVCNWAQIRGQGRTCGYWVGRAHRRALSDMVRRLLNGATYVGEFKLGKQDWPGS